MHQITGTIRAYAWGSPTALPRLLGTEPTGDPAAELWMGTHPGAPSSLAAPATGTLPQLVAADPAATLGDRVLDLTGGQARLPFLFKVLGIERALSIQAHPSPAQARAGYARENAAGLGVDAPERNYRDDQAKPELACALEPFEALCGFASTALVRERVEVLAGAGVEGLEPLLELLDPADEPGSAGRALAYLLADPRDRHAGLVAACARAAAGSHDPSLALVTRLDEQYPGDPGVLVSLLMNLVRLDPGEALYLPAGNLHAYLSGLVVELMNASDNVLRGGLTGKHIDVPELLSVLDTTPRPVPVLTPDRPGPDGWRTYPCDAATFRLRRLDGPAAAGAAMPVGPAIVFVAAGSLTVAGATLTQGDSAFVGHDEDESAIESVTDDAVVFAATVPTQEESA